MYEINTIPFAWISDSTIFTHPSLTKSMDKSILGVFAFVFLCLSLVANVFLLRYYLQTTDNMDNLQSNQTVLKEDYQIQLRDFKRLQAAFEDIRKVGTRTIPLSGEGSESVVLYTHPDFKHTYIDANQLPSPPGGKQYHAWALTAGEYLSLGTFNHQPDKDNIFQLRKFKAAEAVFITLEPVTGSKEPDLSQTIIRGAVR